MDLHHVKRRIRLRDLDTLMAVAETGTMRKAAERLHLSQPAVSKAIAELEDALGVPLLERSNRGVGVTDVGSALLVRARAVFDELQQALKDIEHIADPQAGHVRFGATELVAAGIAGALVDRLARRYPRMRFEISPGDSRHLIGHFLRERLCEFVVARPLSVPSDMEVAIEPLYHDRLRVVVGPESPFAGRRRLRLAELAGENWVMSPDEARPDSPVAKAFEAEGSAMPASRVVNGSLALRYSLLATGRFVTLMSHSMLHFTRHRAPVRVLPIELARWETPTSIVTLQGRNLGPAAQIMIGTLRELAATLPE